MSQNTTSARPARSKKIRALLAGGLVLGVGAAITLANWNDSEFALGEFGSGSFNLEGSTDGSAYGEHPSTAAAPLSFSVDAANLSPGDVVSAPFAVRLDADTTYDAALRVRAAGTQGSVSGLTYRLTVQSAFGCDAAQAGTVLVAPGTALGSGASDAPLTLAAGSGGAAGAPVNVCFTVTAGSSLEQGQSGTATWEFAAESDS
jgi:predicted ribosomally synthesized peptide with SipW-like signal peptide